MLGLRSLRSKIIVLLLATCGAGIGLFFYSSLQILTEDKINFIYTLNTDVAKNLGSMLEGSLSHREDKIRAFSMALNAPYTSDSEKARTVGELFRRYGEFVVLSSGTLTGESLVLEQEFPNSALIDATQLATIKRDRPLQEIATELKLSGSYLANSSIWAGVPSVTFAFTEPGGTPGSLRAFVATLTLDAVLSGKVISDKEIYEVFLLDRHGRYLVHPNPKLLIAESWSQALPVFQRIPLGAPAGTFSDEEDGEAFLTAFARTHIADTLVVARVPRAMAYSAVRSMQVRSVILGLVVVVGVFLIGSFFARALTQPLSRLGQASQQVAAGNFDVQTNVHSRDEVGNLAQAFVRMGQELKERDKRLQDANMLLVQSEKMSAFGQLSAGIAHEVKNPLAGILGYVLLAKKRVGDNEKLAGYLQVIEKETVRCKDIIQNLMTFARQEKSERVPTDLALALNETAALVDHQLTLHGVKIIKDFPATLPPISGNINQLKQVFLNMMINAQHAMEKTGGGSVTLLGAVEGNHAVVRIRDTGSGMPEDVKAKIFEPFFTTKEPGKGTGLGLSVSVGILKDHACKIEVESEVGKGTTFVMRFPLAQLDGNHEHSGNGPADTLSAQGASA